MIDRDFVCRSPAGHGGLFLWARVTGGVVIGPSHSACPDPAAASCPD